MAKALILLTLMCTGAFPAIAQDSGSPKQVEVATTGIIYGMALDQSGQPAKQIGLTAYPLDAALGAILPHTKTANDGSYQLSIPWWGRYTVSAEDESAGYSYFSTGVGQNEPRNVTLSPEMPRAALNLVLPPKGGFLDIHLTNNKTGELLKDLMVEIRIAPSSDVVLRSRSDSSRPVLVPSHKQLFLHVSSGGFREWQRSLGDGLLIHLEPGERMTFNVQLDPSP